MPRTHVVVPSSLDLEIREFCRKHGLVMSKLLTRGAALALAEARRRYEPAPQVHVHLAAQATPPQPAPAPLGEELPGDPVLTIRRGDAFWFDMKAVCTLLDVPVATLLDEIDPADDVLNYVGRDWIDEHGVSNARSLSRKTHDSDIFGEWVAKKLRSPT